MKNTLLISQLFFTIITFSQIVDIPDDNFKYRLLHHGEYGNVIDTNDDGEIQVSEAEAVTELQLDAFEDTSHLITDMTGIESFVNLTHLNCKYNQITTLDLTENILLENVTCDYNLLTSIDVTNCPQLIGLHFISNNLSEIDLSNNPNLEQLYCNSNNFTALNTSLNPALKILYCDYNNLTDLYVNENENLEWLLCRFNQLAELHVENCGVLSLLTCDNNLLTNINISNNSNLSSLYCSYNQISSIDLNNNAMLRYLHVPNNPLSFIDVSNNYSLKYINCSNTLIASLDLSHNPLLEDIRCTDNDLTFLDLRNGNNEHVFAFKTYNNPNLTCIFVDDKEYSQEHWDEVDSATTFVETQEECDTLASVDYKLNALITIYPNPTDQRVCIDNTSGFAIQQLVLTDALGKELLLSEKQCIDVAGLSKGVYILKIYFDDTAGVTKKIIIE